MHIIMFRYLFFLLLLFPYKIFAQSSLSGRVLGENNTVVSYASIKLLSEDSVFVKGTLTDAEGNFIVKDLHPQTYVLCISSLGYKTIYIGVTVNNKSQELAPIQLETDDYQLKEIVVRGNSVVKKDNHILIIPDKLQKEHSYTGFDMVYNMMIPGVKVDRRTGKVRTMSGDVSMYINGVKAESKDIENLRGHDILKIEYYDIPTGRYAGEPAVINYIIKKHDAGGYVSLSGEQSIGYNSGKYDVAGKTSIKKTSISVYGGHNYSNYNGITEYNNEQMFSGDRAIYRNATDTHSKYIFNQQYGQVKVCHDSKKHNICALLSLVRDKTPNDKKSKLFAYSGTRKEQISSVNVISSEHVKPSLKLSGNFSLADNQELSIIVDGSFAKNKYKRDYSEASYLSNTMVNEDFTSFGIRTFYNIELKHHNSMYFSFIHFHNIASSTYSGDYASWQHLWTGETLLSAQYMQKIKDKVTFMVTPGLSVLNYKLHGNRLERFYSPKLNSWILYDITSKQQAGIGVGIGNNTPNISYLNEMDQTIDQYRIKRGNPKLDNTKIYDIFAKYQGLFRSLNVELNLWHTTLTNNIIPFYYLENNKIINSFQSNSTFHKFKIDLALSYKFSDRLRTGMTVKYERMSFAKAIGLSENNYFVSFDANYFIGLFTINAYMKTGERSLDNSTLAILRTPASYGCSVKINKNNWMIEAGVNNPFTKHSQYKEEADFGIYQFNKIRESRLYQQTGYIKAAYTFNFGKKIRKEYNTIDKSVNSAILK